MAMSTTVMTEQTGEASLRFRARTAGVFYLFNILTGVALFVPSTLVVHGHAAATATNILSHKPLVWLGFADNLLATACYIVVTALLYGLFKPVSSSLSWLAAFFSLVGCAVGALGSLLQLAPLVVLGGGQYLSVFKVEQLHAVALMLLELNAQASIPLVFFGFYCLLIGYLILRSTFLPRIVGVLMGVAGLGWLTFLFPPLANYLYPYNLAPGVLGEGALTLWLLVMGVNVQRWQERASAAAAPSPGSMQWQQESL